MFLARHGQTEWNLQRHLLGLDPHQALTRVQPNDVVYRIDPAAGAARAVVGPPA